MKKVNLNRKRSPCTSVTGYNFGDCIDNKIIEKVGCRPFWISYTVNKRPVCDHPSQYVKHFERTSQVMVMNDVELIKEFGCIKPCTYMEYKVNFQIFFWIPWFSTRTHNKVPSSISFQIADEPITVKSANETVVGIKFDSPNVLTETEEEACSLSSLVADCGGVLGLFVGFNFLMIWDFICFAFHKLRPHCKPIKV